MNKIEISNVSDMDSHNGVNDLLLADKQVARHYGDADGSYHTEKILRNVPDQLRPFLRDPTAENVEFIQRSGSYATFHCALAVLGNVYSWCKMVLIKEGEIGLTWNSGAPEILPSGRHVLLSPSNTLDRVVKENEKYIQHGPIHIIRVGMGELGFGIDGDSGSVCLLKTGKHVIQSATFTFEKFISFTDAICSLGKLNLVRVETGKVGYIYRSGELQILAPGLHCVSPPDRFGGFITTQLSILELDKCIHESSDYVPLEIKAAVFYRIDDPLKALTKIQNITDQIRDMAISTLAGIIRSSSLEDVARGSTQMKYEGNRDDDPEDGPSAPPFYQFVHDEFLHKLAQHVLEEWGIEIQNIRIESLRIADAKLHQKISQQAVSIAEQRSRYLMLQKQTEIISVEAQNRNTEKRLQAEGEANALLAVARAESEAQIIRAEAEKQSLILKGTGEAERARMLNETPLGAQLASLELQKDTLSGVNQVLYVPHLPSMFKEGNGIFMDQNSVFPHQTQSAKN